MMWFALGIIWAAFALFAGLLVWRKERRFYRLAIALAAAWTVLILLFGHISAAFALRQAVIFSIVFTACTVISLAVEILIKRGRQ
jgi:hypothetical protein